MPVSLSSSHAFDMQGRVVRAYPLMARCSHNTHTHTHTLSAAFRLRYCSFFPGGPQKQFGQNACGELGLGDAVERHTPTLSNSSRGKGVVHVTAGNELTAVLTNTGEVGKNSEPCDFLLLLATCFDPATSRYVQVFPSIPTAPVVFVCYP